MTQIVNEETERFRALVRERTGMTISRSRATYLERALARALSTTGVADVKTLNDLLSATRGDDALLVTLLAALNVSETHFFRNAPQIEVLEQRVLPDLIQRRSREKRLRIWSAGCSTGEEAYSLAILVSRLLPDIAEWDVLILATDINERSLEVARRGRYPRWSLRGAPEYLRTTYLVGGENEFEVVRQIRDMVSFAELNLAQDAYPDPSTNTHAMDLIVCRNVLLYFDDEGTKSVVRRLGNALAPDGWLMLGTSEATLEALGEFAPDSLGTATYRKRQTPPVPASEQRPPQVRLAAGGPTPLARSQRVRQTPAPAAYSPPGAPDPPVVFAEVLALWKAGRAGEALVRLEAEDKTSPRTPSLDYLTGMILLEEGRTSEALSAFRRCTYGDPTFALAHLAQGIIFASQGSDRRASIALDTAARLVEGVDLNTVLLDVDVMTGGDILSLINAQRELLTLSARGDFGV